MSSHVFHDIFLHINWHTKRDYPALRESVEASAHGFIREKSAHIKGVRLCELGGTDTHVHLAVEIEPLVTISDLVQELKGASSFEVNRQSGRKVLEWQRGYGVVSFGRKHLPWIVDYIRRQREHHANGRVFERLETHESDQQSDDASPAASEKPG